MAGAASAQALDLARRARVAEETVDQAFARRQAEQQCAAILLSIGDRLASLVLKGLPKLDELERLAERWRRTRREPTAPAPEPLAALDAVVAELVGPGYVGKSRQLELAARITAVRMALEGTQKETTA